MNESALPALLGPVIASAGLEIDSIEVTRSSGHPLLRIRLDGDGPDGTGPTLEMIGQASRLISRALDNAPKVTGNGPYTLEISTRGADRPLSKPAHFRRNRGRLLACELRDRTSLTGRIVDSDDACVRLDVDGRIRELAYGDIAKAVVRVELKPTADGAVGGDEED